jgi:hypothetical protein
LKALSGYAEWFWLLATNLKPVENRDWPITRYIKIEHLPLKIYLHASKTKASQEEIDFIKKTLDPMNLSIFEGVDWSKYRGHIIGEAIITGQIEKKKTGNTEYFDADLLLNLKGGSTHSPFEIAPWFFGEYGFLLKAGKLYNRPVPYKGRLGFFEVDRNEIQDYLCRSAVA